MDQTEIKGLRIAYQRAGEGPAIVLLHGGLGLDSREWRRQLEEPSDEFTVVAWDMPGCGHSSDPPEGFGPSDYIDCFATFIEALGLERPHVLGLSFGSGLALELYRRYPTLPRTLILASAYAGGAARFHLRWPNNAASTSCGWSTSRPSSGHASGFRPCCSTARRMCVPPSR